MRNHALAVRSDLRIHGRGDRSAPTRYYQSPHCTLICGSMAAATVLGALLLAYPLEDGPAAASTGQAEPCDALPDG